MSRPSLLQLGTWPGRGDASGGNGSRSRRRVERLGERPAIVMVAAAERGAIPERFGLGVALETLGSSVLRGWLIIDDGLDRGPRRRLAAWARRHWVDTPAGRRPLELMTLRQFFNYRSGPFTTTCYGGCGPFIGTDLGRMLGLVAEASSPGRGFWGPDGWSLYLPTWSKLDEDGTHRRPSSPHRPPLRMKAAGPHGLLAQFGRCAPGMGKRLRSGAAWSGRFIDVVPAAHALDGTDSSDLGDHLDAFGFMRLDVPAAVTLDSASAGQLLDAARSIHALSLRLDNEAARWGTGLDIAKLYSPATIGTELLRSAGVRPLLDKFPAPDDEALDRWQAALHGGWQTAELGGTGTFPAVDIDVRSSYPACASLLGWWGVMRAEELCEEDATDELRALCAEVARGEIRALLDPATWRRMGFTIAELLPEGDELPVDVIDEEQPVGGLSWRPVRSEVPLPYAWPHVVLSALRTGRVPVIISAIRLVPIGIQVGLRRLPLLDDAGLSVGEDPIPWLAQRRQAAKNEGDDRLAAQLRVVENAMVFGTPARLDQVPGREGGRIIGMTERPAPFTFSPIAATVSAGSALLVGIAEHLIVEVGGTVASRDTDGLLLVSSPEGGKVNLADGRTAGAIAWSALDEVLSKFNALDPFGDGLPVWKIDREHRGRPLHGLVLRQKRYATFTLSDDGSLAALVDATEHALASIEPPPNRTELRGDGRHLWTFDVARRAVEIQLAREAGGEPLFTPYGWEDQDGTPALIRTQFATPDALSEAPPMLGCKPFSHVVRPLLDRRFGMDEETSPPWHLDPGDLDGILGSPGWRNEDGHRVRLSIRSDRPGLLVDYLEGRSHRWMQSRPERSFGELIVTERTIRRVGRLGVLIDAAMSGAEVDLDGVRVVYIEADLAGEAQALARKIGPTALARATGVPLRTAKRLAGSHSIEPREETIDAVLIAEVSERRCEAGTACRQARGGLSRALKGRQQRWCSEACKKVTERRKQGVSAPHGRGPRGSGIERGGRSYPPLRAQVRPTDSSPTPTGPKILDIDPAIFAGMPTCSGCGSIFAGVIPETCPKCGGEILR